MGEEAYTQETRLYGKAQCGRTQVWSIGSGRQHGYLQLRLAPNVTSTHWNKHQGPERIGTRVLRAFFFIPLFWYYSLGVAPASRNPVF